MRESKLDRYIRLCKRTMLDINIDRLSDALTSDMATIFHEVIIDEDALVDILEFMKEYRDQMTKE